MCIKNSSCRCGNLEIAIKQDHEQKLKQVFERYFVVELYHFISDAYKVIELKDEHHYSKRMNHLVQEYLLDNSPNSINVKNERLKLEFMSLYDEHIDDLESAKVTLDNKLAELTRDVQFLAYQNLSHDDYFIKAMEPVDKSNSMKEKNDKSSKCSGCTIL
ncbi:hypothetical protein ELY21_04850 [Legionella sp. km535]|uniref:hypothetical protein n=1 Tax=Legionella sp. km535 TaxID=2498107 RepID=UPI000F8D3FA8|nr:hypothetical protein [Legionella sp. km535]RUR19218.1 hypothetical protein ELY21_04850 [Legionella sp. km535]